MRTPVPVHRLATGLLGLLLGSPRRHHVPRSPQGPVVAVLLNAYGIGGATRSVLNLTGELARDREVEIVSIFRKREQSGFPFPAGVHVMVLDDRTTGRSLLLRLIDKLPSLLMHPDDDFYGWFSIRSDLLLLRRLRSVRSGFLLTSRPAVSALAARVVRPEVTLVAQEHTHLDALLGDMPREVARAYGGCDAVVLLTERDRAQYAGLLEDRGALVRDIPNGVSRLPGDPAAVADRAEVVVAAGRLVPEKGFDLLVQAWALVHDKHPEWRLEIYGDGRLQQALLHQVELAGLAGVVLLPGATRALGPVLASAAVFALSSRSEGMPQVVLEAMSKSMPVVAFDCPTGPRELITDGVDGLLLPPEDVDALAAALLSLIEDPQLRAQLGTNAAHTAARYDLDVIGQQWRSLLDGLAARS